MSESWAILMPITMLALASLLLGTVRRRLLNDPDGHVRGRE